ncbi:hypothetical protein XAB3213_4580002 [Xanthomonas citri pv. bilvae]|nr:hypothetical protein XAB3213_4580002 [Xanthomonas citri pv. bilvae]
MASLSYCMGTVLCQWTVDHWSRPLHKGVSSPPDFRPSQESPDNLRIRKHRRKPNLLRIWA